MYSRGSLGFLDYTEEEKQMFKPVLQRLVRTHRRMAASRCICRRTPAASSA
jgi:hypothetical protein